MPISNTAAVTTTNGQHHPPPRVHVAVCAFPFGTHAAPLLQIVRRMAVEATDTHFTFLNREASNSTLFHVNTNPNIVPLAFTEENASSLSFIEAAPCILRQSVAAAEAVVGKEVSCVVGDAFLWGCEDIAKEKGVGWISVWTAGPHSLSAHFYTDLLRANFPNIQGAGNKLKDELINCVPGFSTARFIDLPSGVVSGDLDSTFSRMLHKMGLMLPKATAVCINSFDELSLIVTNDLKSKMHLISVGPFSLISPPQLECNDPYSCIPWLNKQKAQTIVYISFGTFATLPQEEVVALAEGLKEAKVAFIWSMSDATREQLPNSILEWINRDNEMVAKIVPWAPQRKILAHSAIGAFITHCGWNSTLDSMEGGVPLICRPVLGDQILNRRFIEMEFKCGVGIEGGIFTKSSVKKALHQVLSSEGGKEMRKRAKMFKALAEEATKPGGSSYKNFNAIMEIITLREL